MPLAETELASQPDRQHDKIAPKPKTPSQIEGFVEQHNYKWFFKASNAPVDPPQVQKVTVTVKLHADHIAADGNRAVTSEVNRPAISPIVTVARRQRTPSWKSWVTQDSKTGKKLFIAKGLVPRVVHHNVVHNPMTRLCLPVDRGRRVNLNLFAACICYIVATSFHEQHREGAHLQGIFFFQICYEYKDRRLNNILIIGNPRDTDINRQCIHNQTNLGLIICF